MNQPNIILSALLFIALFCAHQCNAKDEDNSRGIVIQSLEPNRLGVGGAEFRTMQNPKGEGVFVYDPRTKFHGVKRFLIWVVINDRAYPLNGPSKMITPSLKWPRDAEQQIWAKTGLSPYSAADAIKIVFGSE